MRDLVIIGTGPAALTAAIYAARENLDVAVYEKTTMGGLASGIHDVENYPGFPDGISGMELIERMRKQAEKFGAEIDYGEVSDLMADGKKKVLTVDGTKVETKAVLVATGCSRNKLGVKGEDELSGKGVHYCATCDGAFYKDKRVVVIGGANSAVQEALFLTKFAREIEIVSLFDITASEILKERLEKAKKDGKIVVHVFAKTQEIMNENGRVAGVRIEKDGKEEVIMADGVFIFVGQSPASGFLAGSGVELTDRGFVKTDAGYETSVAGIFAAGDVRDGAVKQIVCACGEGAGAAMSVREYLERE